MSSIQPSTNAQDEVYWQGITQQFMVSPGEIYLNTGSWGVQARPVFEALVQRMEALEGNPTRNRKIHNEAVASSRKCLAQFVNAPPENLTFVTNVTIAINHVVLGLTWQPGDEILTSDQEYGAIDNCLHHASQRWGLTIKRATIPIPPSDPQEIVDAFRKEISDKTRLLVCSHIASQRGLITPVQKLADLAHHHGALIAIDGAHAPGMIPLDLETYGVDFYGGNCHKWLCAPKGTGFLYARSEVQDLLQPIAVSWGYNQNGATRTEDGQLQINGQPFLWQLSHIGTRELACFATVADAIAFQNEIGKDRILARGKQLTSYLRQKLGQTEWAKLVTPTHPEMSGLLSTFQLEGFNGLPLGQVLYDRYRITTPVSQNRQNCTQRVSTHIYNSFSEIDTLVDALTELREEALA